MTVSSNTLSPSRYLEPMQKSHALSSSSSSSFSSSSLFCSGRSQSSSSQSDFTPLHSPSKEEPVSLCPLPTLQFTKQDLERVSDLNKNAAPTPSTPKPRASYLTTQFDETDMGYESGSEGSKAFNRFGSIGRKHGSLSRRRARELSTPGQASALRRASELFCESTDATAVSVGALYLDPQPTSLESATSSSIKAHIGLGLGLPSDYLIRTSGVITPEYVPSTYVPPRGPTPPPCRLPSREFEPRSPHFSMIGNEKPRLRPILIAGSPSPIDMLPSPLFHSPRLSGLHPNRRPSVPLLKPVNPGGSPTEHIHPVKLEDLPSPMEALPSPLVPCVPIWFGSPTASVRRRISNPSKMRPQAAQGYGWTSPIAPRPIVHARSSLLSPKLQSRPQIRLISAKAVGLGLGLVFPEGSVPSSPSLAFVSQTQQDLQSRPKTRRQRTKISVSSPASVTSLSPSPYLENTLEAYEQACDLNTSSKDLPSPSKSRRSLCRMVTSPLVPKTSRPPLLSYASVFPSHQSPKSAAHDMGNASVIVSNNQSCRSTIRFRGKRHNPYFSPV